MFAQLGELEDPPAQLVGEDLAVDLLLGAGPAGGRASSSARRARRTASSAARASGPLAGSRSSKRWSPSEVAVTGSSSRCSFTIAAASATNSGVVATAWSRAATLSRGRRRLRLQLAHGRRRTGGRPRAVRPRRPARAPRRWRRGRTAASPISASGRERPPAATGRPTGALRARDSSLSASASAGWAGGTPSIAEVRPFSAAFSASQFASTSAAVSASPLRASPKTCG